MFSGQEIDILDALIITLFSMGLVFVTLLVISFILGGFKAVFYKDNKKKNIPSKETNIPTTKPSEPAVELVGEDEDEELVAVITAALAASLSKPSNNLIIKSIKRVSNESPAWARVGRQEQVYNKL